MDANFKEKRRKRISSQREKRWSMNSQRLEEIVAELMRPIGDLRHSFDTDLSALLEEYLTEAGLHALDEEEEEEAAGALGGGGGSGAGLGPAVPNFAELALLLQQSASIYGRKVDFLYQHVLTVSDSLHNSTIELSNTSNNNEDEAQTPSRTKRKRKESSCGDFTPIELEPFAGARREPAGARPPPTLPRMYIELEPRVLGDTDAPLLDYAGEPVGLLADFHVAWRLQGGRLVDELAGPQDGAPLRPIPLMELQAAIEAAAPPSPPPLALRDHTPPRCSTPLSPLPAAPAAPAADMPPPPPPTPPLLPLKKERKRKSEVNIEEYAIGPIKLRVTEELLAWSRERQEFSVPLSWHSRVIAARARAVVALRRRLRADAGAGFRGFEFCSLDVSGFGGWSSSEAAAAAAAAARTAVRADDSDDDGFFEQSSLGDSDASRHDDAHSATADTAASAEAAEWAQWRARAAARAAAGEARPPPDVRALAAAVLRELPPASSSTGAAPFPAVLAATAKEDTDVSRTFLATLFLANAGNVEIVQGPPLTLNSFSLKLKSTDEKLYTGAMAAEPPVR